MTLLNEADAVYLNSTPVDRIYAGAVQIWPEPAFSPLDLFSNGEEGAWYDSSDLSTVFQDDAGTTPAVSPGDPVGLILDKSGNAHHAVQPTLAARPVLGRVTEEGVPDVWYWQSDLSDDRLEVSLPQAINGDLVIAGLNGSIIEPVSYAAETTFEIGPGTYTGGTLDRILEAIGGIVGVLLIDRTLSEAERDQIISYFKSKGAKGLLVPGPELVVNGDFSDGTNGWSAHPALTRTVEDGRLKLELISSVAHETQQSVPASVGKIYVISCEVESDIGNSAVRARVRFGLGNTFLQATQAGVMETKSRVFLSSASSILVRISVGSNTAYGVTGDIAYFDNISVRELRAEEDW